jgi:hypothetical protein
MYGKMCEEDYLKFLEEVVNITAANSKKKYKKTISFDSKPVAEAF